MSLEEQFSRRINSIENRVEKLDEMIRGDSENEGILSIVRQLAAESKQRKYIQATILVGVTGLLVERILRMVGLLIDKL